MLAITHKLLADGAVLYWAALPTDTTDLLRVTKLTDAERTYFDTLKASRRKIEWLAVRYILQQAEPTAYIVYTASGKPTLQNSDNSIAITHSSNYAAVLLSKATFVGLDMEQPADRMKRLASRFLAAEEFEFVDLENTLQLCLIWSAKEAVVKATDNRAIHFNTQISVSNFVPADVSGELAIWFVAQGREHQLTANYIYVHDVVLVWLNA